MSDTPPPGHVARTIVKGSFVTYSVWELDARDGYGRLLWERTLPLDTRPAALASMALRQLRKLREAAGT